MFRLPPNYTLGKEGQGRDDAPYLGPGKALELKGFGKKTHTAGHTGLTNAVKLNSDEPSKGKVWDSLAISQQTDRISPYDWYEYYLLNLHIYK